METTRKPQLLLSLIVLSALFSQMLAWPLVEARFVRVPLVEEDELDRPDIDILHDAFPEKGRNVRRAAELFTRDLSSVLDELPEKKYLRSLTENGDSISENQSPSKRTADAISGHYYAQLQRKKALKRLLWKQIVPKQSSRNIYQKTPMCNVEMRDLSVFWPEGSVPASVNIKEASVAGAVFSG
ncbi:VIP peptides-like [Rousettus aegyptiacus]|uniref:VIP peptides-like n=1 Tax=Rousettus aegyptiacus TaxID=9407 RepID=UPI00168D5D5E|nr:VIP peptides-like [Rousettus aegyptiacus]